MIRYLSLTGVARRVGLSTATVKTYSDDGRMPPPDAVIGDGPRAKHGWLPATIDAWCQTRPGRGARTDLRAATATANGG